ncbi:hypothetical protein Agub_g6037, partial [Astrephomene gubernaculifera]
MVAGMPNTGKSSLINALKRAAKRHGLLEGEQAYNKTARAGPLPGVTLHMGGFKVCRSPLVYVLDTPGVLSPSLRDAAVATRLALAGLVPTGGTTGGPDEGTLLRSLVQLFMTSREHRRQLWCVADGQITPPALAADSAAAAASRNRNERSEGEGEGSGVDFGAMRREARALRIARLLYDVVSLPSLPPPAWHPGVDERGQDE